MNVKNQQAFHSLDISRSALQAQRRRMDAIAENLANIHTTSTVDGGPFKPRVTVMSEALEAWNQMDPTSQGSSTLTLTHPGHLAGSNESSDSMNFSGVETEVIESNRAARMEYDPDHPDANPEGFVAYPDINVVEEMTHLMAATRAYEANLTAISAAKEMAAKALDI
jgi:flagellar basal-body rod protein FlgC